jgi:hypothetical protein
VLCQRIDKLENSQGAKIESLVENSDKRYSSLNTAVSGLGQSLKNIFNKELLSLKQNISQIEESTIISINQNRLESTASDQLRSEQLESCLSTLKTEISLEQELLKTKTEYCYNRIQNLPAEIEEKIQQAQDFEYSIFTDEDGPSSSFNPNNNQKEKKLERIVNKLITFEAKVENRLLDIEGVIDSSLEKLELVSEKLYNLEGKAFNDFEGKALEVN